MTGIIVFAVTNALGLLSFMILLPSFSVLHGPDPVVKAAAVLAGSLVAYNLVTWRMGLGWTGQSAALAVSAAVLLAGRRAILAIVHHPGRVTQEGDGNG